MLKEDDFVLCTVKKIEGTTVFVEMEDHGEGNVVMSEIAAGRIRNLRDYVFPNKKIVCKVLRIINNHPQLSLRRVTAKERDEVLEKSRKEQTFKTILKSLSPNYESIIEKIKKDYQLSDFLDQAKDNLKLVEKYLSKDQVERISKIWTEKDTKEKSAMKTIIIKSDSDSGILQIKETLSTKEAEIKYLGSSKFSVKVIAKDFKEANQKLDQIIKQIETKAKEKKLFFEIKK